jgi:hypothetical protein
MLLISIGISEIDLDIYRLFMGVSFGIRIDDNYSTNTIIIGIRNLKIVTFKLTCIFKAFIISQLT